MNRFAESRVAAAVIAAVWAAVACPLIYVAISRASMQLAMTGADDFDQAQRVCAADAENAECAARLALAAERFGMDPLKFWDRAVELNRHDADLAIQAALAHEAAGGESRAERLLLEAAERSRTWLPRWSLANFYYRRGRPDEVAHWARLALNRGYGDRGPLFRLCRSAGLSHDEILGTVLETRDLAGVEAYMAYVRADLGEEAAGALARAAERWFKANGGKEITAASADELALVSEALVRFGKHDRAFEIWERLRQLGALGEVRRLDGSALGDAGFTGRTMAAPGFGWAMATEEGVELLAGSPPGMAKIEMRGGQPENFVVLSQRVRLDGEGRWVLRYESAASGDLPPDGHFVWLLANEEDAGESARRELRGSPEWSDAEVVWDTEGGFRRLSLLYRRPLGAARWAGELRLRNLRLRREGARR